MSTKKSKQLIEHKIFNASCPSLDQGVDFHWCYDNYTSFHDHDYYEFIVITDGKIRHLYNSTNNIASQGMLFLVKPGEFHQFLPYHNNPAKHMNFAITSEALHKLSEAIWLEDTSKIIDSWKLPNNLFLPKKDFESISNSIERLSQFPIQSKNTYAVIKNILLEILIFLFQKSEILQTFNSNQVRPAWLDTFLNSLNDPNVFTMKLKDIYPLAPYSQSMLNTYFNKYVGTTLITYITKLKINYACTLLRHTDSSPLEISSILAYDSLSHFNRIFKKFTGLSPIAYRKKVSMPTKP